MKKNHILIVVLIGMVLLFITTKYFKKNSSSTFNAKTIQIDSSLVDKILIRPSLAMKEEPIIISRNADGWEVAQGNIKSEARMPTVKNALRQLQEIKTERLVAKTDSKWASYELTDSRARSVEITEHGKEKTIKLYFGKTNCEMPKSQQYGRNPVYGTTYFRTNTDPRTYTVKMQLSTTFNQNFSAWRNSDFIKIDKDMITQLEFENDKKNDFSLVKIDTVWMMGTFPADPAKVTQYLITIRNQNSSQFADEFTPTDKADITLTIRGESMNDIVVRAYMDSIDNKFFLNSSQHPNVYVKSDSTGLFKRLFVDQDYFGDQN